MLIALGLILFVTSNSEAMPSMRVARPSWGGEDAARAPETDFLSEASSAGLFEVDPDQDLYGMAPGDLIAFNPDFPRTPIVLKQASSTSIGQTLAAKLRILPKRARTMGAHRFLRYSFKFYEDNSSFKITLALPDGRVQTVTYQVADDYSGYVADVKYSGEPHYDAHKPAAPYHPAPVHKAPHHAGPIHHHAAAGPVHRPAPYHPAPAYKPAPVYKPAPAYPHVG
eukprot:maker-scaffold237_size242172-snap-gene-1.28 protein:Tk05172 transcript:maker-scaffold237_size242172-snap-gene-1.28-mRNA-1 annotation:"cuticle protein"